MLNPIIQLIANELSGDATKSSAHMTVRESLDRRIAQLLGLETSPSGPINDRPIQPTATASGIWDPTISVEAPTRPRSSSESMRLEETSGPGS
jgi:hypothetical protein